MRCSLGLCQWLHTGAEEGDWKAQRERMSSPGEAGRQATVQGKQGLQLEVLGAELGTGEVTG